MNEDQFSRIIVEAAIEVHRTLGYGSEAFGAAKDSVASGQLKNWVACSTLAVGMFRQQSVVKGAKEYAGTRAPAR